eukprot:scaffold98373_cov26-Tisochrysis_lutea.AAC.2
MNHGLPRITGGKGPNSSGTCTMFHMTAACTASFTSASAPKSAYRARSACSRRSSSASICVTVSAAPDEKPTVPSADARAIPSSAESRRVSRGRSARAPGALSPITKARCTMPPNDGGNWLPDVRRVAKIVVGGRFHGTSVSVLREANTSTRRLHRPLPTATSEWCAQLRDGPTRRASTSSSSPPPNESDTLHPRYQR